jgi:hypothetical protein
MMRDAKLLARTLLEHDNQIKPWRNNGINTESFFVAASVVGQPRPWLHHGDAAGASPHERLVDLVESRAEPLWRTRGSPCVKITRRRGKGAWAAYRISVCGVHEQAGHCIKRRPLIGCNQHVPRSPVRPNLVSHRQGWYQRSLLMRGFLSR